MVGGFNSVAARVTVAASSSPVAISPVAGIVMLLSCNYQLSGL